MWKYGDDNRIAITFRRIVNHCDGSAKFRSKLRCPLRPACGIEPTTAPKKRPAGSQDLETAGAATGAPRKKRRSSTTSRSPPTRSLKRGSIEEHRVYIEAELCRLSPEASLGSQEMDEFLRYVEKLMVIVDKWDEDFERGREDS